MNLRAPQKNQESKQSQKHDRKINLNAKPKKGVNIGKRTASLIISGVIVLACFATCYALLNKQSSKVLVARFNQDLGPGTMIKEDMLTPFEMVFESYEDQGTITYKDEEDKSVTENIIVRWEDRSKMIDQFTKLYTQNGQILTKRMTTPELLLKSPWTDKVEDGMEFYTMPFSVKDIYSPILYPGSHLRIRMIYDVPTVEAVGIKTKILEKERQKQSGQYIASGESVIITTLQDNGSMNEVGFSEAASKTVPISEIVFDDIVVVDMLNSADESIFDLYTELLGLPVDKRMEYLKTQIEGQGNETFKQKVTPSQLVFVVTKKESTNLSEFEALGAKLKYTLLPQNSTDYSLMSQFTEVGNQVQSFLDNSNVSTFN